MPSNARLSRPTSCGNLATVDLFFDARERFEEALHIVREYKVDKGGLGRTANNLKVMRTRSRTRSRVMDQSSEDSAVVTGIAFSLNIGPFRRGTTLNNEEKSPGLGQTIAYDSPAGEATIYVTIGNSLIYRATLWML
jgi:hypothetical protein